MAELENKLTWSHSRQNTFNSCKRKYYYQHYGSWGGWDAEAPNDIRQAYCLKNIDGVDAYLGNLVHRHISEICVALSKSRDYDHNVTVAIERELDQAFAQSKSGGWKHDPKNTIRFFEDHYRDGFTADEKQAKREKAVKCLQTFLGCKFFADLEKHAQHIQWLWIDKPVFDARTMFSVNGFKAFGKLDLAFRSGETLYVIDFKTGKKDESEEEQIGVYALYARDKWVFDLDKLVCGMMGLYPGYELRRYKVDGESLARSEEQVKAGYADMQVLHQAGLEYETNAFSRREDESKCEWCNFKEMCKR